MKKLFKFLKDEEGIEIVEWALMAAGFALVVYVALGPLSTGVQGLYTRITDIIAP